MPWNIRRNYGSCSGYAVVKESDGSIAGCHETREKAGRQIAALEASEADKAVVTNEVTPNKYPQGIRGSKKRKKPYKVMSKADLYSMLTPEEKAFHDALVSIAEQYGPFDQGTSSIWVGYETARENEDADIGVKCSNCSFFNAENNGCAILSYAVEPEGKCRLAAIPDGLVNPEMDDDDDMDMEDFMDDMMERMGKAASVSVGQMVSWNSSGGRATGKVTRIIRNGKYNVPGSDFTITGTPDDPAVAIRVYRDGEPTDTIVGHKMSTLRRVGKSMEEIDSIKEVIKSWNEEEKIEKSSSIETDSAEYKEVPKDLSSIFANMPTHAKRVNTMGNSPLSLNLFRNKDNG